MDEESVASQAVQLGSDFLLLALSVTRLEKDKLTADCIPPAFEGLESEINGSIAEVF